MQEKTGFDKKCEILAEFWLQFRNDEDYEDFVEYNDVGLPLSYVIHYKLAEPTKLGIGIIEETWDLFLQSYGIEEDTGFESLMNLRITAEEIEFGDDEDDK